MTRYRHLVTDQNRKWWTLGAMCFALFMIMLDNTIVNVALPSIQRDLGIGAVRVDVRAVQEPVVAGGKLQPRAVGREHDAGRSLARFGRQPVGAEALQGRRQDLGVSRKQAGATPQEAIAAPRSSGDLREQLERALGGARVALQAGDGSGLAHLGDGGCATSL